MSIIELATRRLEELRRGGIEVPGSPTPAAPSPQAPESLLVRATRRLEATQAQARGPAAEAQVASLARSEQPTLPQIAIRDVPPVADRGGARSSVELDFDRLDRMGYLTPRTPRSQIASDFRVIKRQLLVNVSEA